MRRVEDAKPVGDDAIVLDLAARSPANVMVTGSNRVDRAALARTLHDGSPHCDGPLVAVCGQSIPTRNRPVGGGDVDNWFERAAGGTLFIDQVGDLSTHAQRRLLSLLIEQSGDRSGTTTSHRDRHVRIISGSDRSLRADLATGTFSDALFYRLNVIHIDQLHHNEQGEAALRARALVPKPPYACTPNVVDANGRLKA